MVDAVTPPNPDQSQAGRHGNPPQSIPDPTLLTIDALRREIAMLESLTKTRLEALEDLTKERFHRVDVMLSGIEDLRREQKADTKSAVDAALSAQEQATHKMEKSISDSISSLTNNFETSIRGVHSNIADLKDRMTIAESIKQGMVDQRGEHRAGTAGLYATIGLIVTIILATLTIIAFIT